MVLRSLPFILGFAVGLPLATLLSSGNSKSHSLSLTNIETSSTQKVNTVEQQPAIVTNTFLVSQAQIKSNSNWQTYTSSKYKVNFKYPKNWQPVKGEPERYSGRNGFFLVSAGDAATPQAMCQSDANHKLRPYGSRPQILSLKVQNQPACLILPSADQPRLEKGAAKLIARYPQPVQLDSGTYRHFALYANKQHIRDITKTVKFIQTANQPSSKLPQVVIDTVFRYAYGRTGIPGGSLQIIKAEKIYTNGCLNLPKLGEGCTKINMPAWEITLQAGAEKLVYRSDETGSRVRLNEATSSFNVANLPQQLKSAVLQKASQESNVPINSLKIVKAEQAAISAGCERPTFPYPCDPVLNRGWQVTVNSGSQSWTYRTNLEGSLVQRVN
ncbi:MAG TPA: hypothetical protein V6D15_14660 [Oculatellaceae cyanobacterium]|jgi:hypothetical protein